MTHQEPWIEKYKHTFDTDPKWDLFMTNMSDCEYSDYFYSWNFINEAGVLGNIIPQSKIHCNNSPRTWKWNIDLSQLHNSYDEIVHHLQIQ